MGIGLHKWDIMAWSCFGGSLDRTGASELPLLLCWWLSLLIFRLCIGSLRGTMPYKILSDEVRGCIVGMHESGLKSSNIAFVLNVPWSIVSTILTKWKVRGSVNLWNLDAAGIRTWLIMMLECWHVMLEMIEDNHCQNCLAYWIWIITQHGRTYMTWVSKIALH